MDEILLWFTLGVIAGCIATLIIRFIIDSKFTATGVFYVLPLEDEDGCCGGIKFHEPESAVIKKKYIRLTVDKSGNTPN